MPLLFHQNMRNFGGGTAARNAAYQAAFAGMLPAGGGLAGLGPIYVGGFTEVLNNGAAAAAFSGAGGGGINLCGALGLTHIGNVACGRTVLANGPEFVAMGYDAANCVLISVGRIMLQVDHGAIRLLHDVSPAVPPAPAWLNQVPAGASYDFRGLVYAVIDAPNGGGGWNRIAVGFLHNLYTFEAQRILVMQNIPQMLAMMGNNLAALPVAHYIGGDFNVHVVSPRGTSRIGFAHAYSIGMAAAPVGVVPPVGYPAFVPGGTLWSGNLYDYWYSTVWAGPPPPPVYLPPAPLLGLPAPLTDSVTLNAPSGIAGTMSDHCAIALQI